MKGVRMSNIQLYIIIVRCEQRDGPPRPSAHHVTGRLIKKKKKKKKKMMLMLLHPMVKEKMHLQENTLLTSTLDIM